MFTFSPEYSIVIKVHPSEKIRYLNHEFNSKQNKSVLTSYRREENADKNGETS